LDTNQTITANKAFTNHLYVQNGDPAGAMSVGADVWGTSLTANTRKLGRIGSPAYSSNS